MGDTIDKVSVAALKAADTVKHGIGKATGSEEVKGEGDRSTIRVDYDFSAPPPQVWRALTEPALLERWLFPNDFASKVRHRFTFRTTSAPGFDGMIRGEVMEAEPAHRLVYSWQSGPADTVVTWTLEPAAGDGTHLSLTQTGFRPEDGWIYELLKKGWSDRSGELLKEVVSRL